VRILYVTWDSPITQYLSGLFIPIFEQLRQSGIHFDVVQFTWGDRQRSARIAEQCRRAGIGYRRIDVNRVGPLGPLLTALAGSRSLMRQAEASDANAILARSTMPALSALLVHRRTSIPLLFDADGLPLDERIENLGWKANGFRYRFLRGVEARMVRRSRGVLVRTLAARDILITRAGNGAGPDKFHLVGNGRDPARFAPLPLPERQKVRAELGIDPDGPLLVYAGSWSEHYCPDEMLRLLAVLRETCPGARLLVLTTTPGAAAWIAGAGSALAGACIVMSVEPAAVPRYLAAADIGLAFRRNSFAMQAVAPIKIGEYLLCGLPVIGSAGIGDIDDAVERGAFFPVAEAGGDVLAAVVWARGLLGREELRATARAAGLERYSLSRSVDEYRAAITKSLS
jgi:glycosyltransferase involved in cell wall biosynthesis